MLSIQSTGTPYRVPYSTQSSIRHCWFQLWQKSWYQSSQAHRRGHHRKEIQWRPSTSSCTAEELIIVSVFIMTPINWIRTWYVDIPVSSGPDHKYSCQPAHNTAENHGVDHAALLTVRWAPSRIKRRDWRHKLEHSWMDFSSLRPVVDNFSSIIESYHDGNQIHLPGALTHLYQPSRTWSYKMPCKIPIHCLYNLYCSWNWWR